MNEKKAVINLGGKQHLVSVGSKITVNRLVTPAGENLDTSEVLLTTDGEKTEVGTPFVDSATVTLKVLDHIKGKKIDVSRFRSKSRYRRKMGHRQPQSTVEVTAIKA